MPGFYSKSNQFPPQRNKDERKKVLQAKPVGFYNDLITQKSWQTLQSLKKQLDFVLIGGWAVWLYTRSLKSKDIDIIINYDQLEKLRQNYSLTKNDRLTKFEARNEEVQIDVYLPFFSKLGLPVEEITKDTEKMETFTLPSPEMLLAMKLYTFTQRGLSAKGQKDRLDILSLITKMPVNYSKLQKISPITGLVEIIQQTTKIPELDLNEHQWSKIKKSLLPHLNPVRVQP